MDLGTFSAKYINQSDSQPINWFKLDKDKSAKIIIPQPTDEKSLLGVANTIFVKGSMGGRNIRATDETYNLLMEHGLVPAIKASNGSISYAKPQIRVYLNVLDITTNELKLWETSKSMIKRISAIDADEDTPPIHECVLKITKRSKGPSPRDVEYDIQSLGKVELTPEQQAICKNLYDVERHSQPHSMSYILALIGADQHERDTEQQDDDTDDGSVPF
jgi:hypothetical protein